LARYTIDDLEILIATTNRSDLSFLESVFSTSINEINVHIVVVNQSKESSVTSEYPNIKVINDPHKGISRSRNIAIAHATKPLLWILDDDCVVTQNAIMDIVKAHNEVADPIITFKTKTTLDQDYYVYPERDRLLSKKELKKVLSPEITLKKGFLSGVGIGFNERFGLNAQFGDSENYVFLTDALEKSLSVYFRAQYTSIHEPLSSSDDVASKRVIYARGALAARESFLTAPYYQFKYVFFLWRKGYVTNFGKLWRCFVIFGYGVNDYLSGFKGHRKGGL
jgi:glycosyltransferase involved in cell wall biosynthesis